MPDLYVRPVRTSVLPALIAGWLATDRMAELLGGADRVYAEFDRAYRPLAKPPDARVIVMLPTRLTPSAPAAQYFARTQAVAVALRYEAARGAASARWDPAALIELVNDEAEKQLTGRREIEDHEVLDPFRPAGWLSPRPLLDDNENAWIRTAEFTVTLRRIDA